ncbi:MAG: hypothetical protein H7247_07265 [Polaromonas sp.]|nr:hypothetical protein [Gemmatimonadaceae bacterium]
MSLLSLALFAQLAAPVATLPVLSFPERGLDDSAAYQGYQTRFYRDAAGNTVQVYLDSRADRVVHLWADADDESFGFTARGVEGRAAALQWNGAGATVWRAGRTRTLEHALMARDSQIDIGWFLLGSMRVERDLLYANRQKTPFADAPYTLPEMDRLLAAVASLEPAERRVQLTLLHAISVEELRARLRPVVTAHTMSGMSVVRVAQVALDGADTLALEIRSNARQVTTVVAGDSVTLRARSGGSIPFTVRIITSGSPLTPLRRGQIFNQSFLAFLDASRSQRSPVSAEATLRARRLERQVRGLELLSSHEKLMAGLPTYATYFGRDMLMTALMMRPVWRTDMSEFVIASALRKLSPTGQVSHEEALGGQAVREAASEYAALVADAALHARGGNRGAADSATARARDVLLHLRRVRENYHMIDAEFQFPIVAARWLTDVTVSAARKRAFLLDRTDSGGPRIDRLLRELALVARVTAPYAAHPVASNFISFAPRDSGRWASQSWRDSNVGYAGGRYAMDVNAIWAPHALESVGRILDALRTIGFPADSLVRAHPEFGVDTPMGRYLREPSLLQHATATWQGAARAFLVRLTAAEVRARTSARLAAMPEEQRQHWTGVRAATHADDDSLTFLALSLDGDGYPIDVANSDPATRLFLGEEESARIAPDARTRAAVLRDVQLFARPYPVGLLVPGVGPAVANDAYASPSIWRDFDRDRYHGPRVIWGRENNLFLIGTMARIADASTAALRDPDVASYVRTLRDAMDHVRAAVDASGFHSELWSYDVRDGRVVPVRYGSGSDVQLWSTTDLVVQFELYRLAK